MLNQLNTTTKRELDARYLSNIEDKLQGSKQITNTSRPLSIPDYGMTESIELYFKPSQDLHGYDKPWVGGAGKNKLKVTATTQEISGITFTINGDGSILVNGTASQNVFFTLGTVNLTSDNYILNGSKSGGVQESSFMLYGHVGDGENFYDTGNGVEFTGGNNTLISIAVYKGYTANNLLFKPMIRLATETDATFEPYANICPIIGQDKASLSWNTNQGIAMNFGTTYYGGVANFEGTLTHDWQRIASYDGESLPGEWLSDRDEYASGTTPTTGAEVVYKTTPSTVRVTRPVSLNLTGDYPITYNGYKLDVTYQPKDTILEEAKSYTNEEIAKLGLPQPPISNGTYNLVCTVASGTPTLSWETTT